MAEPNYGEQLCAGVASFNTRALLQVVLGGLRRFAPGAQVVVVDNGSTDGSVELVQELDWVRLVRCSGAALGAQAHGAALDQALALCRRPLFMSLDSDAVPVSDAFLPTFCAPFADGGVSLVGTNKDQGSLGWWSRHLLRLGLRRPGPEWDYVRPNRAVYRTAALSQTGLGFAPGEQARVGEALARFLASQGGVRLLANAVVDDVCVHLRHATLVANRAHFPSAKARDVRAAAARLDKFMTSAIARELVRWCKPRRA